MTALRWLWRHRTLSVLLLAGLALGYQQQRVVQAREAQIDAELARDSAEAAADTTRRVLTESLQGQARYYQRRVVQVREMTADSVEEALDTDPRFRGDVTARVDELAVSSTAHKTRQQGRIRAANFSGYEEPYRFRADVKLPPPDGAKPTMRLRVKLDPIPLRVRVGCEKAEGPVRPAQATVRGPEWATLRLDSLRQSAEVCNRPAVNPPPVWPVYVGGTLGGAATGIAFADQATWEDAALGGAIGLAVSFGAEQAMDVLGLP